MGTRIDKTVLANGLTVISQSVPAVRSVAVGIWIKTGTRYENKNNNGIAHFLEHMVFKGTENFSALRIAQALEEVGGSLNAYTSKELTVYYTHSLDSHLKKSVRLLADLVCRPLLREKDVQKEKSVVLEEISTVKDTPDELVFDLFHEKLFPEQSIGFPILGTEETVRSFSQDQIVDFWRRFYCPENMLLSAAGNLKHEQLVRWAESYFTFSNHCQPMKLPPPKAARHVRFEEKEAVNQSHICAGIEGLSYLSDERYQLVALNSYLGGGMSSRLFQVVREKYGLAYSVYSYADFYRDTGVLCFYMGTEKSRHRQAEELLFEEIERVRKKPLSKTTVSRLREQLKGNYLLGLESMHQRMSRMAKNELYYGRQISLDELIHQKIEAITPESLLEIARKIFIIDHFNIVELNPDA
ncbi:MAG TPA: insulinase family protein [Caldithrix abyssi]|uniref:Insulinase family protein n=1 Tax=Caldithrix abyssi TaxID=187145 RepID=A0A7V5UF26_CALAY|nr:insulinase family protein [Caldithrix abyssi]